MRAKYVNAFVPAQLIDMFANAALQGLEEDLSPWVRPTATYMLIIGYNILWVPRSRTPAFLTG